MCLAYYGQPDTWTQVLGVADIIFIVIFTVEAVLKIVAYQFGVYWRDNWNKFDFIIVIVSYPGLIFKAGASTSVFRVFRIGRILRLIKKARQLNLLFSTLVYSLPSLRNVGLLLFIVYFIFAVIGVSLFGGVEDEESRIDPNHRNFDTWPAAMNLLYIGSTGDSWTTPWQGLRDNYSDKTIPALYNLLFFVVLGLVMLNLFIGVILDTYDQNDKINQAEDKMLAVHTFTKLFNLRDKTTIGHITVEELMGVLKDTPWPIGFAKPLKNEHEDNLRDLKTKQTYEKTKKRLDAMARLSKKQGSDAWIDPTEPEVAAHISSYSIEVKKWKAQDVWVIDFEQTILSFATKLLEMNTEEEKNNSKNYKWLRTYYTERRAAFVADPDNPENVDLYQKCLDGKDVQNDTLGDKWLELEADPDPNEDQEGDNIEPAE